MKNRILSCGDCRDRRMAWAVVWFSSWGASFTLNAFGFWVTLRLTSKRSQREIWRTKYSEKMFGVEANWSPDPEMAYLSINGKYVQL